MLIAFNPLINSFDLRNVFIDSIDELCSIVASNKISSIFPSIDNGLI